jgi:hypothetical protein
MLTEKSADKVAPSSIAASVKDETSLPATDTDQTQSGRGVRSECSTSLRPSTKSVPHSPLGGPPAIPIILVFDTVCLEQEDERSGVA